MRQGVACACAGGHLVAEGSFQGRRRRKQGVSETVGGPGGVGGEVGVCAVEDPQPRQQLVAESSPGQLVGAWAGVVGEHEGVFGGLA